jgi:micrococcal nuclease
MPRRLPRRRYVGWSVFLIVLLLIIVRLGVDWQRPPVPDVIGEGAHKVGYVFDGDTLRLVNGARVRTREFLRGGEVLLRFDRERIDRYGRFLAYAYVDDQMLNEALLRAGFARARTDFNYNERYKRIFRQAQSAAQQAGRGIWSEPWLNSATSDSHAIPNDERSPNDQCRKPSTGRASRHVSIRTSKSVIPRSPTDRDLRHWVFRHSSLLA